METKELSIDLLSQLSEEILKTLPIAHYLKTGTIKVNFDKYSQTSYYDPSKYEIFVALNNIVMAINGAKQSLLSNKDIERHIRSSLYHELSHVILTPPQLMRDAYNMGRPRRRGRLHINPDLANIIEDERIETIFKNYYLNVDFKSNVRNLNELQHAQTFEHFVFNAVRLRYSPIMKKQVNDAVDSFIKTTRCITRYHGTRDLLIAMSDLVKFLEKVWKKIVAKAMKNQSQNQDQNQQQQDSSEEDSSSTTTQTTDSQSEESGEDKEETTDSDNSSSEEENEEDGENEDIEDNDDSEEGADDDSSEEETDTEDTEEETDADSSQSEETEENGTEEDSSSKLDYEDSFEDIEDNKQPLTDTEIKDLITLISKMLKKEAQACGGLTLDNMDVNTEIKAELLKVIVRNVGVGINQSPIQYGYGGKFNAKRFMKDHQETFKWFEKKQFEDSVDGKKSNVKTLNIWLDNSGSFRCNDYAVNEILKALYDIENERDDFRFNLITFNYSFTEKSGANRISVSGGGTRLDYHINTLYPKYNPTGEEYNILLTDGEVDMIWNAVVFNNKRSVIITADCNVDNFKKVCPSIRDLIVENNNYPQQLSKNVARALDSLF